MTKKSSKTVNDIRSEDSKTKQIEVEPNPAKLVKTSALPIKIEFSRDVNSEQTGSKEEE